VSKLPLLLAVAICLGALPLPAAEPGTGAPILIPEWKLVGPFAVGSREGFVHHLAGPDGRVPKRFTFEETYPSVLADGGRAGWTDVESDRDEEGNLTGRVSIKMEGVDWEARQGEWGVAGLLNSAYLYGEFTLDGPSTLILHAARCGVAINGTPYPGDPYGHGITRAVVPGKKGVNRVVVRSARYAGERWFEFRLVPVTRETPEVLIVGKDVLLPDLVRGEAGDGWAGVPIINTTDRWLEGVTVSLGGAVEGRAVLEFPLAPYAPVKVPVPVHWDAIALEEDAEPKMPVQVTAFGPRTRDLAEPMALVRKPEEARAVTFRSRIDGSAQFYGMLPPKDYDPEKNYSLILSTHGAGVNARSQASAHAPKDWAFVVAPTNRRPFGFDWHDWGRLDFEEVLDQARARYPVVGEFHLVGHSMGGHGAWILGVHHATWLRTLAPSAGWISHDTYVPITLRRSGNLAPPELACLYLRGTAADKASLFLENLRDVPVMIVHGGADDNVPPTHARLMAGALEGLGHPNVTLKEVPEQGHWWDIDKERPGADCVDATWLEEFWKSAPRLTDPPQREVLVTSDPDVNYRAHSIYLLEPERTADISRIHRVGTRFQTRNVKKFGLYCTNWDEVVIDGDTIDAGRNLCSSVAFEKRRGHWRKMKELAVPRGGPADHPGGYKKALYEPFLLVAGTQGPPERQERSLHLARLIATSWWRRANGYVPIVRDTDLTDDLRSRYNLVLLGGPEVNAETKRLARDLNIVASEGRVTLAGRPLAGEHLASAHWQRSPRHRDRKVLVFQATDAEADPLLNSLIPLGSGIGLPDYVVMGHEVRLRSWGGFVAAGYWDQQFRYDPSNGWRASD